MAIKKDCSFHESEKRLLIPLASLTCFDKFKSVYLKTGTINTINQNSFTLSMLIPFCLHMSHYFSC